MKIVHEPGHEQFMIVLQGAQTAPSALFAQAFI